MDAQVPASTADDLHYHSLLEVSALIRARALSPVALTEAMLARIAALDGRLGSYTTVLADHALAAARQAELELQAGHWRGPLHGIPIAVKDLCNTVYGPTSAGMAIHRQHVPSANATVVERLDQGGAVILGKLSMTEGALSEHHPKMKTPINPWLASAWTGVSSSGSGVATAAGLCFGSLGSDTGGSIRLPSAANGLTGIKPTWGRVSRHGVFALADSLDHVGPIARNVGDAAALLQLIAGHDRRDATSLDAPVPDYLAALGGSIAGLRIGIDERFIFDDVDPQVAAMLRAAISAFEALGARLVPMRFPSVDDLWPHWLSICSTECAIAHRDTFPSRRDEYGAALAGMLDIGHAVSGIQLAAALQYRLTLHGQVRRAMLDCDLLLMPTVNGTVADARDWNTPIAAEGAADGVSDSGRPLMARARRTRYTAVFDMTGHPTLSLNGGFDRQGVPLGFQLVAHHLDESVLLKAGHAFQSITPWHTRHPDLRA
ncbi:MAG: amidase [Janthinobacterium lividum]